MKNLTEYIEESCITPGKLYFKYYENFPLYSFEDFCNENHIDLSNKYLYDGAVEAFDRMHWTYTVNNHLFGYKTGQEFFYETLSKSLSTKKLKEKLEKEFPQIFSLEEFNKYSSGNFFQLKFKVKEKIWENEKFDSILNLYNYCIISCQDFKNYYELILKPNISEEVTDIIHAKKYLYHITSKIKAEKILKYGFHPKSANNEDWSKTFFFPEQQELKFKLKSLFSLKGQLLGIKNVDINNSVILRVDISKLPDEMKFFRDNNFGGAIAVYTFEPISPKAIEIFEF